MLPRYVSVAIGFYIVLPKFLVLSWWVTCIFSSSTNLIHTISMSLKITVHVSSHTYGFILSEHKYYFKYWTSRKNWKAVPSWQTSILLQQWLCGTFLSMMSSARTGRTSKLVNTMVGVSCWEEMLWNAHGSRVVIVKEYLGKQRDLSDTVHQSSGS